MKEKRTRPGAGRRAAAGPAAVLLATVLLAAAGCGGNAGGSADSGSAQQSGTDVFSAVDFTVSVEEGKDPVVLQLTDPQFTDLAQAEEKCYRYMRETIENTSPDLILVTGDLIYGHMDDDGSIFVDFVEFMEGFDIPWAPIFGNHDAECEMGADWMCARLEEAENCLFLQRELSGNGNYTVGIEQGGALKRVFFMLDSNGCSQASAASLANGHTKVGMGLEPDQMRWFVEVGTEILEASPETKISFVCHIPPAIFSEAFAKYGYTDTGEEKINIDRLPDKDAGDFGYIGEKMVTWDSANIVWNAMKGLQTDSLFVGHCHTNSASVVYEGVRFQFGQKSSTYDSFNSVTAGGEIVPGSASAGTPLVGGTVIPLSGTDGSLLQPYIYLCGDAADLLG